MISNEDLDRLQAYLDGSLPPQEEVALEARLKSEPELADVYVSLCREERVLTEWASSEVERRRLRGRPATRRSSAGRYGSGDRPSWLAAGLIAAGALVALALVLVLSSSGPNPDKTQVKRKVLVPDSPIAAPPRLDPTRPLEEKIREIDRERQKLESIREQAKKEEERRQIDADLEKVAAERRAAVAKLEEERRQAPALTPEKAPTPAPARPPDTSKVQETKATVARVHWAEEAFLKAGEKLIPLKNGDSILADQVVEVREPGIAVLVYSDQTRVVIGGGSELREFKAADGKRLFVAKGTVTADVSKQPADQPMVFAAPQGEATVLGTTLRIAVDPKGPMRLDVEEGKVRLTPLLDGKSVDVISGHYAVAAAGVDMISRPILRDLLPFDRTCPVIYTNNGPGDCFTDEYLMALSSAGDIKLKGMITCLAVDPWPATRAKLVTTARRSGMKNIPDPVLGPAEPLQRPASGKIEETRSWGSPGGRLIVTEARKATPKKPLVIIVAGDLSAVADAYLLDPSIADRLIVASHDGRENSLSLRDWATYIVVDRLRVVLFGLMAPISVASARLSMLPEGELRQTMMAKGVLTDSDSKGALALMRPNSVLKTQRKSVVGWVPNGGLSLTDDPNGRLLLVTEADRAVVTEEFWRALEKPAAWGQPK